MTHINTQPTTLIQLSGGIDSTYILWKWLLEHPTETCIVQHIVLKNSEGRIDVEKNAVYKILEYLKSKNLTNFIYIENYVDYGRLGIPIKDVELCGFFASMILRVKKWRFIKEILLPIYDPHTQRESRRLEIMKIIGVSPSTKILYPLENKLKSDIIKEMPEDLYNLCWYCRKPQNGQKCEKCPTCVEVKECWETINKEK